MVRTMINVNGIMIVALISAKKKLKEGEGAEIINELKADTDLQNYFIEDQTIKTANLNENSIPNLIPIKE
jgi:hypothetical protein